tara:strand:- start:82 stop:387 length:306 start_codon:yes stop_codon:yes gene_type:complete
MSDDDKVVYLRGTHSTSPPEEDENADNEEALRTMRDCLTLVEAKVASEEVDGIIVITFNKDNTSEDYLVGHLNMAEVSHVLHCLLINNVLLTQIDFQKLET